jgi:hypothetical protein
MVGSDGKWRNLHASLPTSFSPSDLSRWLAGRNFDAVIQLGTISPTRATMATR